MLSSALIPPLIINPSFPLRRGTWVHLTSALLQPSLLSAPSIPAAQMLHDRLLSCIVVGRDKRSTHQKGLYLERRGVKVMEKVGVG